MLFFAIDGTLVDNDAARSLAARRMYRETTALQDRWSEDAFVAQWDDITETFVNRWTQGELTLQQQRIERLKAVFGTDITKQQADDYFRVYLAVFENSWQLYPDVQPLLEKYKDIPKGIISNGDKDQQRLKLAKTGIAACFDVVVISDDIGVGKPDPGIFQHAVKLAGKTPAQCWYVGDRVDTDAKAAKDAGLTGVWLNRKFVDEKKEPVPEVISLFDLNYFERS